MSENSAPAPKVSAREIEADLAARRRSLSEDVQDLASRFAPDALKAQAKGSSQAAFAAFKGSSEAGESLPPKERLQRLLDDARDGEPVSLAVVSGAAVLLAVVSLAAVVRAVRR